VKAILVTVLGTMAVQGETDRQIDPPDLSAVLPPPITAIEMESLRHAILDHRAGLTARFFADALAARSMGEIPDEMAASGFRLLGAAAQQPAVLAAFLSHWSTAFFCIRSLQTGELRPLNQLVAGLAVLLARAGTIVPDIELRSDARTGLMPLYIAGRFVRDGGAGRRWQLSELIEVADMADHICGRGCAAPAEATLPRPICFPTPEPLGIALLPQGRLLLYGEEPHRYSPPHDALLQSPLYDTIPAAAAEVDALWPGFLDWIRLLVPAIIDIGPSPQHGVHQTASFGYGLPIYVGPVDDPFLHAEDLVHETQHQRFHLGYDAPAMFPQWNETAAVFASPYRADPRPLSGLHLGLHAFVAVNELRRRRLDAGVGPDARALLKRLIASHCGNLLAYRTTLHHSGTSSAGRHYFKAIRDLLDEHTRWLVRQGTCALWSDAERAMEAHVTRVQAASPTPVANALESGSIVLL
jgi:HEXXH motif-containing protein